MRLAFLLALALASWAQAQEAPRNMREAAGAFLAALPEEQRAKAQRPFDDADRLLVANGAQVLLEPLPRLVSELAASDADVTLMADDAGAPPPAVR